MRDAMYAAEVGDDVFGEDPTVQALEQRVAATLGKSAAVFAPSGTQSNLIALLAHCQRGDEYLVGQHAHTYRFEGGGAAVLGGIQPQPVNARRDGTLDLDDLAAWVKPDDSHFARTRLVCLENTHDGYPTGPDYFASVRLFADRHGLRVHLDGARLFNAAVALGVTPAAIAEHCDTVSVCLSKGLGAPVGSVLAGSQALVREARKWRKMTGGGMRQAGVLAAAGLYALEQNVARLADDHRRAGAIAAVLRERWPDRVEQQTNMVFLDLDAPERDALYAHLRDNGIHVTRPRWVVHLDVSDDDVAWIASVVRGWNGAPSRAVTPG
jgi:threonine aldolase